MAHNIHTEEIGQVVETPCRGYGVVVALSVAPVGFAGLRIAVRHPYEGVLYYMPEELRPLQRRGA